MTNSFQDSPQNKITIMQCRSTYTTGGGPDKTVLLSAEKHDPEKFNIVLVYMRGAKDHEFQVAKWAREKGLDVHEVLEHKKIDFNNFRQIHRLIREYQVDIYHSRDYKTCVIGYILSWFNPRMKLLFTAHLWHDQDSMKMKFYTWLNLMTLKKFHKVIAVSEALKQFMSERGVDREKITVVHNSIDVDAWKRENITNNIREEFQIPATSKVVGYVGRLRYEKDISTLLNVAERVIQVHPESCFLIIGDGPVRKESEEQVQRMGLTDKILFPGFRKDTMNVYAALDVFVSASLTEGTPNTVLEAFAMEVPVIHTEVGGVGEIVQDGYDAILVQPGDIEGITQAVLSVLDNEEKARMLRENGRKSACIKYSFANRLKTIEAIYEEVAGTT